MVLNCKHYDRVVWLVGLVGWWRYNKLRRRVVGSLTLTLLGSLKEQQPPTWKHSLSISFILCSLRPSSSLCVRR